MFFYFFFYYFFFFFYKEKTKERQRKKREQKPRRGEQNLKVERARKRERKLALDWYLFAPEAGYRAKS
jgi:hypothetical protein